jgi:hypothetical protein
MRFESNSLQSWVQNWSLSLSLSLSLSFYPSLEPSISCHTWRRDWPSTLFLVWLNPSTSCSLTPWSQMLLPSKELSEGCHEKDVDEKQESLSCFSFGHFFIFSTLSLLMSIHSWLISCSQSLSFLRNKVIRDSSCSFFSFDNNLLFNRSFRRLAMSLKTLKKEKACLLVCCRHEVRFLSPF